MSLPPPPHCSCSCCSSCGAVRTYTWPATAITAPLSWEVIEAVPGLCQALCPGSACPAAPSRCCFSEGLCLLERGCRSEAEVGLVREGGEVPHHVVHGLGAAEGPGAHPHRLKLELLGAEPAAQDVRNLHGAGLKGADVVVNDVGDVALLLAGHVAVQQDRQPADERLRHGAGPRLGDNDVAARHPLVQVVHKAARHHPHATGVRLGTQLVQQLLVAPADHHNLAVVPQLLCDVVHRLLQLAHALPASHQQHCRHVWLQPQYLLHAGFGGQGLGEDRADGQAMHHDLLVLQPVA
mmetsp:Transcript_13700/g.29411  ORF Transcript_13700/g.29411 Transcript_13700/m.29411 type:complete len:294 (+) Transcript_13700:697-1578(+)